MEGTWSCFQSSASVGPPWSGLGIRQTTKHQRPWEEMRTRVGQESAAVGLPVAACVTSPAMPAQALRSRTAFSSARVEPGVSPQGFLRYAKVVQQQKCLCLVMFEKVFFGSSLRHGATSCVKCTAQLKAICVPPVLVYSPSRAFPQDCNRLGKFLSRSRLALSAQAAHSSASFPSSHSKPFHSKR